MPGQPNRAPDHEQEPTNQEQPAVISMDGQNKHASGQTDQPKALAFPMNMTDLVRAKAKALIEVRTLPSRRPRFAD
jgi:hypothetical protein